MVAMSLWPFAGFDLCTENIWPRRLERRGVAPLVDWEDAGIQNHRFDFVLSALFFNMTSLYTGVLDWKDGGWEASSG